LSDISGTVISDAALRRLRLTLLLGLPLTGGLVLAADRPHGRGFGEAITRRVITFSPQYLQ
jgi:hypothetical protein